MRKICTLLLLAVFMVCCTPSNNEPPEPEKPLDLELTISKTEVVLLDQVPYQVEVVVTSNTNWTAQKSDSTSTWFDFSPASGQAGQTTITVTVTEPNSVYEDRSSAITIKCGLLSESISVVQKKKDALIIYPKQCLVHYSGDIINVDARANIEYDVLLPEQMDWIRHNPPTKGLDMVAESFTIDPNTSKDERSTFIVFKAKHVSLVDTITITQQGNTEPCNYTVDAAGTLGTMLSQAQKDTIIYMKLWGNLNADDFATMRNGMRKLEYLDMSEATIEDNAIPTAAFLDKLSLSRVFMPNNLVAIGDLAFNGCNKLAAIRVSWNTPIAYATDMLPDGVKVEVPMSAVSAYQQAEGWSAHTIEGY